MNIDISIYADELETHLRTGVVTLTDVNLSALMEEILFQVDPEDIVDCFKTEFLEKMLSIRQEEEQEEFEEQNKLRADYERAVGARL